MKRNMPLAVGSPPSKFRARCQLAAPSGGTADPLSFSWDFCSRPPGLGRRDVHVWAVSLDCPASARFGSALDTLSDDERARAGRFHFGRDRRRFIIGRAALRALLGQYLEIDPAAVAFVYGPSGKPMLGPGIDAELKFNLAHSGCLALYAVTRYCDVGIDTERLRMIPELEEIAGHYFSPEENAQLLSLPWALRSEAFLIGWTRKEAYLKARGIGLPALREIEVSVRRGELKLRSRVAHDPLAASSWSLEDLHPASGYVAALVTGRSDVQVFHWTRSGHSSLLTLG
jgi:4'-phosphopantetheinyl transferase